MTYRIDVKEVPEQQVAALRKRASMAVIGKEVEDGFGRIMMAVGKAGRSPVGEPFIVYHEVSPEFADMEICFPIDGPLPADGDVHGVTMEGGRFAFTVHRGPYEECGEAYEALETWIGEQGYEPAGPPREIYLNEPGEGVVAETEIEFPIR